MGTPEMKQLVGLSQILIDGARGSDDAEVCLVVRVEQAIVRLMLCQGPVLIAHNLGIKLQRHSSYLVLVRSDHYQPVLVKSLHSVPTLQPTLVSV